jgi:CheY-like chemotaxis protein
MQKVRAGSLADFVRVAEKLKLAHDDEGDRKPIVFATAYVTEQSREQSPAAGAAGLPSKPLGRGMLLNMTGTAMAR